MTADNKRDLQAASSARRPLPTTNVKFDSTVMWDGREVVAGQTVLQELATQASDATVIHAQVSR
jgi:hypothetical protein